MTTEEEITYYRDTLESGLNVLCEVVGVNPDRYDSDQADGECYLDCFREMAELLKEAGVYYCHDELCFKRKEVKHRSATRKHQLKTDPEPFSDIVEGRKTFEIRWNDRDFQVGDELILRQTKHTAVEMLEGAPLVYTGSFMFKRREHTLYESQRVQFEKQFKHFRDHAFSEIDKRLMEVIEKLEGREPAVPEALRKGSVDRYNMTKSVYKWKGDPVMTVEFTHEHSAIKLSIMTCFDNGWTDHYTKLLNSCD